MIRWTIAAALILASQTAKAEWCDPPVAPPPTAIDVAREFRQEFKEEFDTYFREASRYTTCLEQERIRIIAEMQITTQRYDRFLRDGDRYMKCDFP